MCMLKPPPLSVASCMMPYITFRKVLFSREAAEQSLKAGSKNLLKPSDVVLYEEDI